MSNGSFTYDLTLPNTLGNDVEVKYTEDGENYNNVDGTVNEDVIHIYGLEHFTVFVVVDSPNQTKCDAVQLGTTPYTTCFPTIQQAINIANNGDDIYIAAGIYNESLSINGKRVNIIGAGSGSTIIKPNSGGAVITINNAPDLMVIRNVTIDASNTGHGVFIQNNSSRVKIRNNDIINFTGKGILISNSRKSKIENNAITGALTGSQAGVYIDGNSERNEIYNNNISLQTSGSGPLYGIWVTGPVSGENAIDQNTINGTSRAFQQDSSVTGLTTFSNNIIGNISSPSFAGIYLNGGSADILGNTLTNTVRPIEFWAQDVNIQNNIIDRSNWDGINAHAFNSVNANYNTFSNIGTKAVNNRTSAGTIDATYNKWGTSKESVIQSMINGDVIYDPWYGKDVNQSLTVNEYEKDKIYYFPSDDTLDFNITSEPIYKQRYIAGLWGYNPTGGRTGERFVGWESVYPDTNDLVNENLSWNMITTGWMGGNPPGTPIPEGDYILWVERYYEEGGYVSSSTMTERIRIDDTNPTATINGVAPKSLYNGNKDIKVHAIDDKSYLKTELYRDGESTAFKTYTGAWFGISWLAEGSYRMVVIDTARNSTEYKFTIDKTEPTITVKPSPASEGDFTNKVFRKVSFKLYDQYKIDKIVLNGVEKDLSNNKWSDLNNIGVHNWFGEIEGTNVLVVYDVAGNTTNYSFVLDRIAPVITVDSQITNDNTPKLTGTVDDNDSLVKITVKGIEYSAIVSNGIWELANDTISPALTEGIYDIVASATDPAGNTGTDSTTNELTIDNTNPTATINGVAPKSIYNGNKDIKVHTIDDNYLETELYREGESTAFKTYTGAWFGISWLAEGSYRMVVIDTAGNSTEYTFTIDNTAPSSEFLQDLSDTYQRNTEGIYLSGRSEDSLTSVDFVELYYRGEDKNWIYLDTIDNVNNDSPFFWSYTWTPEDGVYDIYVSATDIAGNREDSVSLHQIHVIVDNTPPVVEITSHGNDAVLAGEIELLGSVTEDNPKHYNISLNPDPDGLCDRESTWNFGNRVWARTVHGDNDVQHTLDTTDFPNGSYMIRLAARDQALNRDPMANTGEGVSVEVICVTIDNESPTAEVLGSIVKEESEEPETSIQLSDNFGLESVCYDLGEGEVCTDISGEGTGYLWNISDIINSLGIGSHTFSYWVFDLAKNRSDATAELESEDYFFDIEVEEDTEETTDNGEESSGENGTEDNGDTGDAEPTGGDVLGLDTQEGDDQSPTTGPTPTPPLTQSSLGTGGYLYAQTTEGEGESEPETENDVEDTEEDKEEEQETEDEDGEVKAAEDEPEEETGRPWWIYPLIILPLLLLFIILWKRRKEEEEEQY
jgi:hypothetical protein